VRPAPVVFMINGTDSRKEDEVQGRDAMFRSGIGVVAVDMPGTGESPVKADVGSERIFRACSTIWPRALMWIASAS